MSRTWLVGMLLGALALVAGCSAGEPTESPSSSVVATASEVLPELDDRDTEPPRVGATLFDRDEELAALEAEHAAVVGVYAIDTETGDLVEYRADERFGYASTHKAFSAGAVLLQSTLADLDREIAVDPDAIVAHSPATEPAAGGTLPLRDVLRAAVIESDNTAGNLLFDELGGPAGLQQVLRSIGDDVTSVDRVEPDLNAWSPGEARDTTTPRQAAETLHAFLYGDVLEDWARAELFQAMRDVTTADGLVRAAAAADAVVASKSGGAGHGIRADIATVERPDRAPVVIAVYTYHEDPGADWSDELVAAAARIALDALE